MPETIFIVGKNKGETEGSTESKNKSSPKWGAKVDYKFSKSEEKFRVVKIKKTSNYGRSKDRRLGSAI